MTEYHFKTNDTQKSGIEKRHCCMYHYKNITAYLDYKTKKASLQQNLANSGIKAYQ